MAGRVELFSETWLFCQERKESRHCHFCETKLCCAVVWEKMQDISGSAFTCHETPLTFPICWQRNAESMLQAAHRSCL